MYIVRETAKQAVRMIPDGKESAMERNETDKAPEIQKQVFSEANSGSVSRTGSNKIVIVLWVAFLLGGFSWFAYSQQKKAAEAERLLNEAYTLYGQREYAASTERLRQSAELGNIWAQLYYGERLRNGFGTEQNMPEAVKWLRKSAKRECAEACYQLGICYENGEGVKRDPDEAEMWYRKAQEDPSFAALTKIALDRIAERKAAARTGAN